MASLGGVTDFLPLPLCSSLKTAYWPDFLIQQVFTMIGLGIGLLPGRHGGSARLMLAD
jgi:hypothetical protein